MNQPAHRWNCLRHVMALTVLAGWLAVPPLRAQGPPKPAGGGPAVEEGFRPLSKPPDDDFGDRGLDWLAISIGVALVGLLGTVAYLIIKGKGQVGLGGRVKKRSGGVTVSETQIDNYRLITNMMTGQTSQVWEVADSSG